MRVSIVTMTFAGSVISLARPESWPRIVMISKKLAIVTIRIFAPPLSKKIYVWLARLPFFKALLLFFYIIIP